LGGKLDGRLGSPSFKDPVRAPLERFALGLGIVLFKSL